ncbi:hypothetical protein CDD80_4121 [Ophiocordyceps camponoti-rufipedis]|uniref:Uncharacterized protein n=1 Tax=Ophiocordyceps camponoti-rufipedis TaxID=2004952 RepID=A0A2C5YW57_9HYPO|nr:hypothetical protein CDD80_4121 [Ophiocordyceps camponoti-rufipedis]
MPISADKVQGNIALKSVSKRVSHSRGINEEPQAEDEAGEESSLLQHGAEPFDERRWDIKRKGQAMFTAIRRGLMLAGAALYMVLCIAGVVGILVSGLMMLLFALVAPISLSLATAVTPAPLIDFALLFI